MGDGDQRGPGWRLLPNGDRYKGDFSNGQFHGKGRLLYKSGPDREYEGQFLRGQRSGLGKLTLADGSVYEGEFAAERRNGLGILWGEDGWIALCGLWHDDTFILSSNVPRSKIPVGSCLSEAGERRSRDQPDCCNELYGIGRLGSLS